MRKLAQERSAEDMMSLYVVFLRALYQVHRNNHWEAVDYGHHLLFERLYDKVSDLVDEAAEKVVGTYGTLAKQDKVSSIASQFNSDKYKGKGEKAKRLISSLEAEQAFQRYATHVYKVLKESMSLGMDDMIMSQVNKSEIHTFLLQQALKGLDIDLARKPEKKIEEEPEEPEEPEDDETEEDEE